jgi:LacI family transcriptional regulator
VPATLKDIAQDLGVSVVTVSKVLRNHSDISSETRERVLRRMKELNYRPNPAARALVSGKTSIIGLVVPDLVNSFFAQVAKGLSTVLRKKGYSLIISSSEEDPALEREEIDQMLGRRVDSLMIASSQLTDESFRTLDEQRVRYILLDRNFPNLNANFVGVDDEAVGTIATEHLISNGRKRIAHIGGRDVSTALGRLEGYRRALARHNMVMPPEYIARMTPGDDEGDGAGYNLMKGLLAIKPRPDSVFCMNDPAAFGAMKAILEAGLRVPEDIAIVGCGNIKYADFLRVPLTSVDQNIETIGERAAKLAISLVESKTAAKAKSVLLEPKLIIRQSSLR